jgi:O-acetyl-ADP-ribose deacetylase (regulator of RNase III)
MLHYVSGDILLTKATAIVQGVAPGDHFDHGLAFSLRELWPAMAKDFRHWCHNQNPKPGGLWAWAGADRTRIVNLLTQEPAEGSRGGHPGKAKLEYVRHSLKELAKFLEREKIEGAAIPKLATGVGGLAWADVKPLLEQTLGDLKIPIFVYEEFHAGVAAKEPQLS